MDSMYPTGGRDMWLSLIGNMLAGGNTSEFLERWKAGRMTEEKMAMQKQLYGAQIGEMLSKRAREEAQAKGRAGAARRIMGALGGPGSAGGAPISVEGGPTGPQAAASPTAQGQAPAAVHPWERLRSQLGGMAQEAPPEVLEQILGLLPNMPAGMVYGQEPGTMSDVERFEKNEALQRWLHSTPSGSALTQAAATRERRAQDTAAEVANEKRDMVLKQLADETNMVEGQLKAMEGGAAASALGNLAFVPGTDPAKEYLKGALPGMSGGMAEESKRALENKLKNLRKMQFEIAVGTLDPDSAMPSGGAEIDPDVEEWLRSRNLGPK